MFWKNLLYSFVTIYQYLKTNKTTDKTNIHHEYIQELTTNLNSKFQTLKQTNDELEQLSKQRSGRLQVLDDQIFLDIHSSSGSILIVVSKSTAEVINVNNSFYRLLEYLPQDIIGKAYNTLNIWVNNQDPVVIQNFLQEAKIIKQQIFQLRTKTGKIKDCLLSAEEIDINGQTLIFYIASDITNITQNSCCMSYRCKNDPDYTMKYVSYDCENLTGYQIEDIVSNTISYASIIYKDDEKDDEKDVWNNVQNALAEQTAYEILYRIKTKTNEIKWVWEKGQGIFDQDNELRYLEGLIEDVSELKNSEDKLFQIRNDLRKQIQLITEELQQTNSGLKLAQEIPILLDALNVKTIADIAELTKLIVPEKIASNIEPELQLVIIALGKVAVTAQFYQTITEPVIQDKILFTAKEELKTVAQQVNNLPSSLQVLIGQIIIRWESVLNHGKTISEDV